MNRLGRPFLALAMLFFAMQGHSQTTASIGDIDWTGPAAEKWRLNPGAVQSGIVCNLPEGDAVTLRSASNEQSDPVKKIKRMAYLDVDVAIQNEAWVKVVRARRCFDEAGYRIDCQEIDLPEAWVNIEYLCDWNDY